MGKRLIIILALVFVVGIAAAAYAEVQNVKVSGDIESMAVFRSTFDLKGKAARPGPTDYVGTYMQQGTSSNFFVTIARARIDADLTDNVSATLRLIGEWNWGKEDTGPIPRDADTSVDIDLAYVTLKEFLYSPLTLIVGRQELHYGNDMIIGDPDTNMYSVAGNIAGDLSKRKAFDAIRAILNYDPLTVDLVYTKVNATALLNTGAQLRFGIPSLRDINNAYVERAGDRLDDDTDLFGINAKYDLGRKNTTVEGYYWYRRIGPRAFSSWITSLIGGTPGLDYKSDTLHTFGARVVSQPVENLTVQVEGALQRGQANLFTDLDLVGVPLGSGPNHAERRAWAVETAVTYDWKKVKYTPSLTAMYAYFSGEDGSWDPWHTKRWRGWDPMFENQTFGAIANALFPQSGVQLMGLAASMKPKEDITAKLEYYYYRFTSNPGLCATYGAGSPGYMVPTYYYNALSPNLTKGDNKNAGQELDVTLTYDYTEDVQFNLLSGVFWPGGAFADDNARTASEVIGSMKVTF